MDGSRRAPQTQGREDGSRLFPFPLIVIRVFFASDGSERDIITFLPITSFLICRVAIRVTSVYLRLDILRISINIYLYPVCYPLPFALLFSQFRDRTFYRTGESQENKSFFSYTHLVDESPMRLIVYGNNVRPYHPVVATCLQRMPYLSIRSSIVPIAIFCRRSFSPPPPLPSQIHVRSVPPGSLTLL